MRKLTLLYKHLGFSFFLGITLSLSGFSVNLNPEEMKDVLQIARTITLVKPTLDESKCVEYGIAIYRAHKRFNIEPNLLVAIAAQETSFREDLPEGKAGEFGLTQIRKIWINNPKFRSVFPKAKVKDLLKPTKAFLYAAWILRDLKINAKKSSIPYWAYYNAVRFENRLKYFLAVNQKLSYLNKGVPVPRMIADSIQENGMASNQVWKPDMRLLAGAKADNYQIQAPLTDTGGQTESKPKLPNITTASLGSGFSIPDGGWIHAALKRLKDSPTVKEKPSKKKTQKINVLKPISYQREYSQPKQILQD